MRFLRRLWNLVHRGRLDDDLMQELDTHVALIEEEEEELRRGLPPDEAYRASRLRFGIPRGHLAGSGLPTLTAFGYVNRSDFRD